MDERDPLTHEVIGAAIEVHREMGPGGLESVYQICMGFELNSRGLNFLPLARLSLVYKTKTLDADFVMVLYFPGRLVVELKAVERLIPLHDAQLLTYLRHSNTKVGLFVNFNAPVIKDGMRRLVL